MREVDPASAERIDARNVRRVVRALEVTMESGVPFSQARRRERPPIPQPGDRPDARTR